MNTQTSSEPNPDGPASPGVRLGARPGCRRFIPGYDGDVIAGTDEVLSRVYGDVVAETSWARQGYTVIDVPDAERLSPRIAANIHGYLQARARAEGLEFADAQPLGDYHLIPGLTDDAHLKIAKWGVPFDLFGIDRLSICDHISTMLGRKMGLYFIDNDPSVTDVCGMRVIRPAQQDHNPFHRDGWFPALRNAVTLWIPVANCSAGSSLRIFSGSHLWPESDLERTPEGARLGRRKFNVPALISLKRDDPAIEPVTQVGTALLFSSFLIHGGGENRQKNKTRVSFELRFISIE